MQAKSRKLATDHEGTSVKPAMAIFVSGRRMPQMRGFGTRAIHQVCEKADNKAEVVPCDRLRKLFLLWMLTLAPMLIGPAPAHAAEEGPLAHVKESVNDILTILNEPAPTQPRQEEERQERIMAEVRNSFNFREMSKMTLARHWRDLSETERERFIDLFAELLKNTYIGRVEAYYQKEVRVNFKGEDVRGDKAVVDTVVLANGAETPINYRMKQEDGKWMVYDVVIEGVSLIRNYRTQFSRIIQREKFAGLLQRIEKKIQSGETS